MNSDRAPLRFNDLPSVVQAKSLIGREELSQLSNQQARSRFVRIASLWLCKLAVIFLVAPRITMFLWPFLFVLTLAVIEGFRNWSHESLHQKLFSQNHIVNSVMTMVLLGLPIMTPFETRHRLHMTHHRNLNQDSDRERHAWHWAEGRKLGKLLLIRELVLSSVSLRFVQGALSARVKAEPVNRRQLAELATLALYFIVVIWLVREGGVLLEYAILWIMPQLLVSPFVNQVRSFAEHGNGSPSISRTTTPNLVERLFLYQANFGYHFEHHVWPSIPESSLPKVHRLLEERGFWKSHPYLRQKSGIGFVSRAISHPRGMST